MEVRTMSLPPAASHDDPNGFQISLRSRCTAMLAGLADLQPDAAPVGQVGAVDRLRNDAVGAKLARLRKNGRALSSLCVQQDARFGFGKRRASAASPLQEWEIEGDTLVIDTVGIRTDRPYAIINWLRLIAKLCTWGNAIACSIVMRLKKQKTPP